MFDLKVAPLGGEQDNEKGIVAMVEEVGYSEKVCPDWWVVVLALGL